MAIDATISNTVIDKIIQLDYLLSDIGHTDMYGNGDGDGS